MMLYELAADPKGSGRWREGGMSTALWNPEVRGQFLAFLASVLPPDGRRGPPREKRSLTATYRGIECPQETSHKEGQ